MPAGRPRKEFDWDQFDKLCQFNCTQQEVSDFFDISHDTLDNRIREKYGMNFSEYSAKRFVDTKISLRRKMWQTALGGNVTMMIFLAKNNLGMQDAIAVAEAKDRGFRFYDPENKEAAPFV